MGKRDSPKEQYINRRNVLKYAGTAGVAIPLAGCAGNEESGGNGNGGNGGSDNGGGGNGGGESSDGGDSDSGTDEEELAEWPDPEVDLSAWVPFSTGGGYDWYVRNISAQLEETLPNEPNIVVENVTGGTGLVAANQLWNSEPDGNTFLLRILSGNVIQEIVQPNQVDFENSEFVNACTIAQTSIGYARGGGTDPIEGWDDLAGAMNNLNIGTPGLTNTATIISIILGDQTGAWSQDDVNFVHYGGTSELMAALDRGEVDVGTTTSGSIPGFVEDGGIQHVATIANEPVADEPALTAWDLPVDGDDLVAPFQLARPFSFPPGTPDQVIETFNESVEEVLSDEEFQAAAADQNRDLTYLGREETEELVSNFSETWAQFDDLLIELFEG